MEFPSWWWLLLELIVALGGIYGFVASVQSSAWTFAMVFFGVVVLVYSHYEFRTEAQALRD